MPGPFCFFLGGYDLEMVTIRDLLREHFGGDQRTSAQSAAPEPRVYDKHLTWGAKVSAYRDELAAELAGGRTPVLIELEDDIGLEPRRVMSIDHHGARAGHDQPTSIEQVFTLLKLPPHRWTRHLALVAANDRGHIRAMRALGASQQELLAIRAADRAAQGISAQQETAAAAAVAVARTTLGGRLTRIDLPHDRTAAAADRLELELGGPGYQNLLILTPLGAYFFGAGAIVAELGALYAGSFYGGDLPKRGYWGSKPPPDDVQARVEALLTAPSD